MDKTSNKPIELKSDRLSIEIAYPGTVYSGSRLIGTAYYRDSSR